MIKRIDGAGLRSDAQYWMMWRVVDDLTPLGALLEGAREQRRMSRRAAARKAKVSEGWWRSVARGREVGRDKVPAKPSAHAVAAMADAVGADPVEALRLADFHYTAEQVAELLAEWEDMHRPETPETPPLPRELDDLIAIYLSADDTEREVILGQVRFLLRAFRPARELS